MRNRKRRYRARPKRRGGMHVAHGLFLESLGLLALLSAVAALGRSYWLAPGSGPSPAIEAQPGDHSMASTLPNWLTRGLD